MIELELLEFRLDDDFAIRVLRLVLEVIVLVVLGGGIELGGFGDFSDDGIVEFRGGGGFGGGGRLLLGGGMIENDRAVLGAAVVALAELDDMIDEFYSEYKELVSLEEYEEAKKNPESFIALIDRAHRHYAHLESDGK